MRTWAQGSRTHIKVAHGGTHLGGLNKNSHHRLVCLNALSLILFGKDLMWPCWRRCVTGGGLWSFSFKSPHHSGYLSLSPCFPLFSVLFTYLLPNGCGSEASSKLLLQLHACLLAAFLCTMVMTLLFLWSPNISGFFLTSFHGHSVLSQQ